MLNFEYLSSSTKCQKMCTTFFYSYKLSIAKLLATHMDAFLQDVFSVDTGETGDCAVDANHNNALKSNMQHTGRVGSWGVEIRQSTLRHSARKAEVTRLMLRVRCYRLYNTRIFTPSVLLLSQRLIWPHDTLTTPSSQQTHFHELHFKGINLIMWNISKMRERQ